MKRRMTQSPPGDPTRTKARKAPAKTRATQGAAAKPGGKSKGRDADRPRVNGPRAIADLMPDIGGAAFARFGFVQSSIVTRWKDIAGERHAALSAPESIRFPPGKKADGVLTLIVASGYAPIIQHIIPDLMARVNRFFGYAAVARIVLRQGELPARQHDDRPPPRMLRPVPEEVGEGLRAIGDPELRAVLEALAGGLSGGPGLPRIG
jgi:hypothetical protein